MKENLSLVNIKKENIFYKSILEICELKKVDYEIKYNNLLKNKEKLEKEYNKYKKELEDIFNSYVLFYGFKIIDFLKKNEEIKDKTNNLFIKLKEILEINKKLIEIYKKCKKNVKIWSILNNFLIPENIKNIKKLKFEEEEKLIQEYNLKKS